MLMQLPHNKKGLGSNLQFVWDHSVWGLPVSSASVAFLWVLQPWDRLESSPGCTLPLIKCQPRFNPPSALYRISSIANGCKVTIFIQSNKLMLNKLLNK